MILNKIVHGVSKPMVPRFMKMQVCNLIQLGLMYASNALGNIAGNVSDYSLLVSCADSKIFSY
ncbi:unnamed protein product [Trifolium pratense]|uniref:Uncharacterized protein n=2 Tax=Trifolium pratense TaxID=57577 RepID=A0ACB0JRI9_TRIPR|nr:unnamed protein product [Trifolium pratense]CAJ2668300.1 unnamed protein product [Trifolium pratense]